MVREKKKTSQSSKSADVVVSLEQIEEGLQKSILSASLALHILRNSRKPTSRLLKELIQIEVEVGAFVGKAMEMHTKKLEMLCEKGGLLAGALSLIPIPPITSKRK